ncbi:MAG: amidase [SAR202 cluster bacterium]|jgi:aspartyl-tRNA(Asn)/glutamyl-tRNA(Gln) amidotransferase subunit A|nr:amidase [SAR202 cluster bacterium]MDP6300837.1 amidase [SAR202 cluster bacterium]MDP7104520.1 amidase [SAR202 cluster bacterium]MDP7226211.1 amidase [SAR202 cluster bacterium]MDP7414466.1 amidase [SAR202 cluster bacterium]|tara:strand:+ start:1492 stop:2844 length:1353 start_codon:yes stop_codon:yes gene_type:complete
MTQPHKLTITEAAKDIRQGSLSCVELIEGLLARVSLLEPDLNVWVTMDEANLLATARRRDLELAAEGRRGPLHGIPVGIKDIYYTQGVKTTACSAILADFVPDYDATTVAKLKRAGAIIMGKTVTTEFACGDPPPTRNPWNAEHTPGGSSSGSAVGVATGMFPAAMGSQTAGSILRPASFNGIVGLKPTFSRVSRYGVVPVSWSLDTMGPFTRTVEDAALMLSVLAGHDPNDQSSSTRPVPDYPSAVDSMRHPPRIGRIRKFFDDNANDEVRTHTDGIAAKLTEAGALIEDVALPTDFDTMLAAHRVLMTVEAAAVHQEWFETRADEYSPNIRGVIEQGMLTPAVAYVQAQRVRRRFRRDLEEALQPYDVILSPSTVEPAPKNLSTTGNPMFQTPFTFGGFPSITLPSGLSADGLPLGIQLAAAPFADETLLAAARWCEQVIDVKPTPPV